MPAAVMEVAKLTGKDPFDLALKGGEDYQLLFTAPSEKKLDIGECFGQANLPAPICIGVIVPGTGVRLRLHSEELEISGAGFDHFPESSLKV
jgi:thiamine-monophosphate kinase